MTDEEFKRRKAQAVVKLIDERDALIERVERLQEELRELQSEGPAVRRFVLFVGSYHYPRGGWEDYVDSFHTKDEAHEKGKALTWRPLGGTEDWYHVVDTFTGRKVG